MVLFLKNKNYITYIVLNESWLVLIPYKFNGTFMWLLRIIMVEGINDEFPYKLHISMT
jgi:hypothetical protein